MQGRAQIKMVGPSYSWNIHGGVKGPLAWGGGRAHLVAHRRTGAVLVKLFSLFGWREKEREQEWGTQSVEGMLCKGCTQLRKILYLSSSAHKRQQL